MSTTQTTNPAPSIEVTPALSTGKRLMSVDALRGFDMFWIVGADALVTALDRMNHNVLTGALATQLKHVEWAGFHFYDLIFPLFVFIVGVSLVFSLSKTIALEGRAAAMKRVVRRSAILVLLGIFYSGGLTESWPNIRLLGVLNRIGLCYFFAALIYCYCNRRTMIAICTALLVGYWAVMTFIPIKAIYLLDTSRMPEITVPSPRFSSAEVLPPKIPADEARRRFDAVTSRVTAAYEPGLNVANHLDYRLLPGRRYDVYWDPEGLLSTVPAIATCLLGVFAGMLLRRESIHDEQKVLWLVIGGIVAVNAGMVWSMQFPLVKKIWTSSFVLVAGGCSALLLGAFYYIVDVRKKRRWCQPFVWIGMNSITIYIASNLLGGFRRIGARLAGGDVKQFFDTHIAQGTGDLVIAVVGLGLAFWFVQFLYRRQIFLRL
jgi:predicted acyltransferase